jgi:hypothetical protein
VIAKPTFLVESSCVLPVVKTSVKVISYKPRLFMRAWLVSPSKDIYKSNIKQKDIRENVASKSDSFCEDTASYEVACSRRFRYYHQ